jgi:hypothetical protein
VRLEERRIGASADKDARILVRCALERAERVDEHLLDGGRWQVRADLGAQHQDFGDVGVGFPRVWRRSASARSSSARARARSTSVNCSSSAWASVRRLAATRTSSGSSSRSRIASASSATAMASGAFSSATPARARRRSRDVELAPVVDLAQGASALRKCGSASRERRSLR